MPVCSFDRRAVMRARPNVSNWDRQPEEDVCYDQHHTNLLIQMPFMHVVCSTASSKETPFSDSVSKEKLLIACFVPHVKDKSQSVPTNWTELGLECHLSKQKGSWI